MATKTTAQGTPPASPHSNWSTAPLLPRKSPERRRIASGHKSTQSLSIPRSSTFSKLEDILGERKQMLLDIKTGQANSSTTFTHTDLKTTELTIPQPTAHDPVIISPKPRRYTDVRALEAAQSLVDNNSNQSRESRLDAFQQKNATPPQMNRLVDLQAGSLTPRRHIRGARSLSPMRHERSESMPFSSAYLDAPHRSIRSPDSKDQGYKSVFGSPITSLGTNLTDLRLSHSTSPSTGKPDEQSLASETSAINLLKDYTLVCLTDDRQEEKLVNEQKSALLSVQAEVDWSAAVLQLAHRQEMRLRHLRRTNTVDLSAQMTQLRQCALTSIAKLVQQSPRAAFIQAVLFETGQAGTVVDRKQAFQLYKDASRAGFARADYRLGLQFERMGDVKMACERYEHGAGADDSACLYRMGLIILKAQYGYILDEQKGTNCIHLSALAADADAPQGAFAWASMLARESALPVCEKACRQDTREAIKYFEKAASLGMSLAQVRLAKAHEFNELDCPYNPLLSQHYYQVAAQGDHPEGDMGLSKWLLAGSDDNLIVKDEARSFHHAALAASRGLASAEFAMGYYFEVGIACPVDLPKARHYYNRAQEHGSDEAKARLDGLSRTGTLSRKDHDLNVQTRIHERRATIKLNQKPGIRQHGRTRSSAVEPNFRGSTAMSSLKPLQEAVASHDTDAKDATRSLINSEAIVQQLQVSQSPNQGVLHSRHQSKQLFEQPVYSSEASPSWNISDRPVYAASALNQVTTSHQRTPSRVPITLEDKPTPSRALWSEMSPVRDPSRLDQESSISDRHKQESTIQSWTQQAASQSALGSPNLAPSEVNSLQEGLSLGSPRPESSMSNLPPPFMRNHMKTESKNPSIHSHASVTGSFLSANTGNASSETSASTQSRPVGATTFEEMGIPMINKQKEDCIIM